MVEIVEIKVAEMLLSLMNNILGDRYLISMAIIGLFLMIFVVTGVPLSMQIAALWIIVLLLTYYQYLPASIGFTVAFLCVVAIVGMILGWFRK